MDDLTATWAQYGLAAMQRTARESPQSFFACCARLLPQNVAVTVSQHYSTALDERDLQILRAIRDAIPNANELEPQAVLEYALNAIRAYDARVITSEAILRGQSVKSLAQFVLSLVLSAQRDFGKNQGRFAA